MLGFFDGEVGMYIFREIIILSFLGALIGLVFGRGLFEFVISTAEIEITMFSRDILPMSYVYSAALPFLTKYRITNTTASSTAKHTSIVGRFITAPPSDIC